VLANAGFKINNVWNDLSGSDFTKGGDWIAIGALKEEEDGINVRNNF